MGAKLNCEGIVLKLECTNTGVWEFPEIEITLLHQPMQRRQIPPRKSLGSHLSLAAIMAYLKLSGQHLKRDKTNGELDKAFRNAKSTINESIHPDIKRTPWARKAFAGVSSSELDSSSLAESNGQHPLKSILDFYGWHTARWAEGFDPTIVRFHVNGQEATENQLRAFVKDKLNVAARSSSRSQITLDSAPKEAGNDLESPRPTTPPESSSQTGSAVQLIRWDEIVAILNSMRAKIDSEFQPDMTLTMSGPGSVAACYCMSIDTRSSPVLFATTFPARQSSSQSFTDFSLFAARSGWYRINTSKWIVFLPNILDSAFMNSGADERALEARKVLIFDDRVIWGETQRADAATLMSRGFQVRRAAMLAPPEMADEIHFIGSPRTGDYYLPWGNKRGRY